jgi:hypothetical protein
LADRHGGLADGQGAGAAGATLNQRAAHMGLGRSDTIADVLTKLADPDGYVEQVRHLMLKIQKEHGQQSFA